MRRAWALTGLSIRIAQALGLHREPTLFPSEAMDAIEVELRRRLWHHIGILDYRTAEALGQELMITEDFFDTHLPRNVDDEELWKGQPALSSDLQDAGRFTGMTLQLIRITGVQYFRKLSGTMYGAIGRANITPTVISGCMSPSPYPLETRRAECYVPDEKLEQESREIIVEMIESNKRLYLRYCDGSIPLQRLALGHGTALEWKAWVMLYHRFSLGTRKQTLSVDMRET